MDDKDIAMPIGYKLSVGPSTPPPPTILIQNPLTGRHLLSIHPDGTVTGEIEDASEAARVFVEHIRKMVSVPKISEQINEREAIVKMVKHDFGATAVRMMLASGVPIGTRTERVKAKAFADGFAKAVSVIAYAIERGEHQKEKE